MKYGLIAIDYDKKVILCESPLSGTHSKKVTATDIANIIRWEKKEARLDNALYYWTEQERVQILTGYTEQEYQDFLADPRKNLTCLLTLAEI